MNQPWNQPSPSNKRAGNHPEPPTKKIQVMQPVPPPVPHHISQDMGMIQEASRQVAPALNDHPSKLQGQLHPGPPDLDDFEMIHKFPKVLHSESQLKSTYPKTEEQFSTVILKTNWKNIIAEEGKGKWFSQAHHIVWTKGDYRAIFDMDIDTYNWLMYWTYIIGIEPATVFERAHLRVEIERFSKTARKLEDLFIGKSGEERDLILDKHSLGKVFLCEHPFVTPTKESSQQELILPLKTHFQDLIDKEKARKKDKKEKALKDEANGVKSMIKTKGKKNPEDKALSVVGFRLWFYLEPDDRMCLFPLDYMDRTPFWRLVDDTHMLKNSPQDCVGDWKAFIFDANLYHVSPNSSNNDSTDSDINGKASISGDGGNQKKKKKSD